MPNILPITELRNTTDLSNLCHAANEPVFITKNGYGDLVVMSMEAYDNLIKSAAVDAAIASAEAELKASCELHDAQTVFTQLRRKHFGDV